MNLANHGAIDLSPVINAINSAIEEKTKKFEFYKPYPIFRQFHELGKSVNIRLLLAANRIGKTYSCLAETAMHATLTYPDDWDGYRYQKRNLVIWVGGLTSFEAEDLRQRLFEGVGDDPPFINPSFITYSNKVERRYNIKNALGGTTKLSIKTYGGREQQNELSTWKAAKVDFILLDEQPTMSVFSECCMRIMSTGPNDHGMMVIAATCTKYTPFVLSFTDRVEKIEIERNGRKLIEEKQIKVASNEIKDGKVYLLAGWDDAEHLSEEEKKNMLANMLPSEIEARTKGMPSIGSGMVYPVLEDFITCAPFDIPKHYARIVGMDFGWTDPTALVFIALDRDTGTAYITFEYSANCKTPDSHLSDLQTMGAADSLWWAPVLGDPAGQASSQKDGDSLFSIYKSKGIRLIGADNTRSSGILKCLQMMLDGRLKIFNTCKKILNEIRTYAYNDKGQIIDGNDHLLDAMRYAIVGLQHADSQVDLRSLFEDKTQTWGIMG